MLLVLGGLGGSWVVCGASYLSHSCFSHPSLSFLDEAPACVLDKPCASTLMPWFVLPVRGGEDSWVLPFSRREDMRRTRSHTPWPWLVAFKCFQNGALGLGGLSFGFGGLNISIV